MPNPSGRIDNSTIEFMCQILLSLTSMYPNLQPTQHPRMCVIFNNVSKNNYPVKLVPEYGKSSDEAIKEETKDSQVKAYEIQASKYIQDYKDHLVEYLVKQYEKLDKQFISERVEILFPDKNFYFFQLRSDLQEMQKEWQQMESFVDDNINSPAFFMESGLLEPVHLPKG